jgi:hypothetical protein
LTASADAPAPFAERDAIELAGKVIALFAAALPVIGVVIRLIGFAIGNLPNTVQLAGAAPITDLAALAALQLLTPVSIIFFAAFVWQTSLSVLLELDTIDADQSTLRPRVSSVVSRWRDTKERTEELQAAGVAQDDPRWAAILKETQAVETEVDELTDRTSALNRQLTEIQHRPVMRALRPLRPFNRFARFFPWLLVALTLVLVSVTPGFPGAFLALGGSYSGSFVLSRSIERTRSLQLRRVWPGILLMFAGQIAYAGFAYAGASPGQYEFNPAVTTLASGLYAELGRADGFVYLRMCNQVPPASVIAVPAPAVRVVHFPLRTQRSSWPSLVDVLGGASMQAGIDRQCDGVPALSKPQGP